MTTGATIPQIARYLPDPTPEEPAMSSIIYLVGLVVIVMAILSFIGLR